MNKKFFIVTTIILTIAFLSFQLALAQNQQEEAANQRLENRERIREHNPDQSQEYSPVQNQEQNQQRIKERNTATNQREIKNPENKPQKNAEQHRSRVANFVLNLLKLAEREPGGLGEQIRTIAREQNEASEKITEKLERIEKRNKLKTFLIGSDYKNLGELRREIVRTRKRLAQLKRLLEGVQNESDKVEIQKQIQELEKEQERIENFIKANEEKFSLFGWVRRLFNQNK